MISRWLLILLLAGAPVLAQVGEISVSGGVSRIGSRVGTLSEVARDFYEMSDGFRLAFRFTINPKEFFGHEFGYAYNRSKLQPETGGTDADKISVPIHQGFYNALLYATPEGSRIRPFGTAGGHFSSFFPPGASVYYGNQETKFGVNYGGGLKARVTDVWGLRVDVRQYLTPKPFDFFNQEGWMKQIEISAGVSFMF
jgi:opacity protein-like surface antigen